MHKHIIPNCLPHLFRIISKLSLLAIFFTPCALSWGPLGHRVAVKMAERRLPPKILNEVENLLPPGTRLSGIANWADEQREPVGNNAWRYANVPITESRYEPRFCASGGCVVSKIEEFRHVLQNPRAARIEKQQALKFLVYLIADLHQPLNVGMADSRGRKEIPVRFYNARSSLQHVWDSQILERHTTYDQVWLWDFDFLAKPKMVKEWSSGAPEDWATESLQIAKVAYCLPGTKTVIKPGTRLGDEYYEMAFPIIRKQLAKAGIRIAWILTEIFR